MADNESDSDVEELIVRLRDVPMGRSRREECNEQPHRRVRRDQRSSRNARLNSPGQSVPRRFQRVEGVRSGPGSLASSRATTPPIGVVEDTSGVEDIASVMNDLQRAQLEARDRFQASRAARIRLGEIFRRRMEEDAMFQMRVNANRNRNNRNTREQPTDFRSILVNRHIEIPRFVANGEIISSIINLVRRGHRSNAVRTDEYGDCILCLDTPYDPIGCEQCKQLIGCKVCVNRWFLASVDAERQPACPLCRHRWIMKPLCAPMNTIGVSRPAVRAPRGRGRGARRFRLHQLAIAYQQLIERFS